MDMKTRRDFEEKHAQIRARSRYGLHLTLDDVRAVANRIKAREGAFLLRQSPDRHLYEIDVQGTPCCVVYDPANGCLRTFLPPRPPTVTVQAYLDERNLFFSVETL